MTQVKTKTTWHRCADALPPPNTCVLAVSPTHTPYVGYWDKDEETGEPTWYEAITNTHPIAHNAEYWAELPELPTTMKNISIKCKGIYMSEESICNQCSNCRWLDTSGEDNPPSEATPLRCDNYRAYSHLD